jgi:hypothetical protein
MLEHELADRHELVASVVGEVDVMGDARAHPRVHLEERIHAVGVAGEEAHELVAIVLHYLQEDFGRLLAVVALVFGPVMNRTPPNARLRTSLVFGAVWPTYCPTRSSRVTATTCGFSM